MIKSIFIVKLKGQKQTHLCPYASDFGRQKGIKQINTLLWIFIFNVSNEIRVLIFFLQFTGCIALRWVTLLFLSLSFVFYKLGREIPNL